MSSKDDKLYALNGQTGSKVWDLAIGDDISSTPTIGNNGLVCLGPMIENSGPLMPLPENWSGHLKPQVELLFPFD